MLSELKVRHFAIIDSVHIHFESGLNILSGETGAGKSILLKSLGLIMGEKANSSVVRSGARQALIEASFDLSHREDILSKLNEAGIDTEEGQMVVRRVISSQGKSKVYINGYLSPLSALKDIVCPLLEVTGQNAPLIEMTGQHENKNLQTKAYHLDLLDSYAGCNGLRQRYGIHYESLKNLEQQMETLNENQRLRTQKLDFLTYQRDEIKNIGLVSGEDSELESNVAKLTHSHRLIDFIQETEMGLYGADDAVLVKLHKVIQRSLELSKFDDTLKGRIEPLNQAKTLIEEVVYDLREYGKDLHVNPESLNQMEDRLSRIRRLQKKYGENIEDILSTLSQLENEIEELENSDEQLQQLEKQHKHIYQELKSLGDELHQRRTNGAKLLAKGVNEELLDLNMKGLTFLVQVNRTEDFTSSGVSSVEFLTRSTKSDQARPLAKFASGGEMSRILLSLKRIIGQSDFPRTFLFDEVDTGVSGTTAEKVGRKLKSIALGQQVICVTHLPQVASFADTHFLIDKEIQKGHVLMNVSPLETTKRVKEIARLISGEKISSTSMAHAKQLLKESQI